MQRSIIIIGAIIIVILVVGFFLLNNYSYNEKQADVVMGTESEVRYCEALEAATKENDPNLCGSITQGRSYGDYIVSVEESIEVCEAEFAVESGNLDYCMTLKETPTYTGASAQRDICLRELAKKLRKPQLCELLDSVKDERYGQTYVETCKTRAQEPYVAEVCDDVGVPI